MALEGQPQRFQPIAQYRNAPDAPAALFTTPSPLATVRLGAFDNYVEAVNLTAETTAELPSLGSTGAGHTLIVANDGANAFNLLLNVAPSDVLNGFLIEGSLAGLTLAPGETVFLRKQPLTTPAAPATTTVWKITGYISVSSDGAIGGLPTYGNLNDTLITLPIPVGGTPVTVAPFANALSDGGRVTAVGATGLLLVGVAAAAAAGRYRVTYVALLLADAPGRTISATLESSVSGTLASASFTTNASNDPEQISFDFWVDLVAGEVISATGTSSTNGDDLTHINPSLTIERKDV